jgi:hypothetical protein
MTGRRGVLAYIGADGKWAYIAYVDADTDMEGRGYDTRDDAVRGAQLAVDRYLEERGRLRSKLFRVLTWVSISAGVALFVATLYLDNSSPADRVHTNESISE